MSQISPPLRIVLAASLLFMVAWFVLLRPGTEPVAPQPAAAPGSGFKKAVTGAQGTAASADPAAAAATGSAPAPAAVVPPAGSTGTEKAPAVAAPKPKDADLGLPPSVAKAVDEKKTLVMLFWNKGAYDDRAVRRELRGIDRHKGKVKLHVASIQDVARYAPITRGVNLEQSPTIVVSKGATADALVGYVDRGTINQAVSDVMRARVKKK